MQAKAKEPVMGGTAEFCILIEDGSSGEEAKNHGKNLGRSPHAREQETCKAHLHKRLRKFNTLAEAYRKQQPKPGKEPKISERRQVRAPEKIPAIDPQQTLMAQYKQGMRSIWNPYILAESESNAGTITCV